MDTSKITGLHGIACEIESATARRAFERDNYRNQADYALQLKRFRYFKGGPEIVCANEQESSAYVRCPTDHQNWRVILVQRQKLMGLRCGG
jgi:hypothetical protein